MNNSFDASGIPYVIVGGHRGDHLSKEQYEFMVKWRIDNGIPTPKDEATMIEEHATGCNKEIHYWIHPEKMDPAFIAAVKAGLDNPSNFYVDYIPQSYYDNKCWSISEYDGKESLRLDGEKLKLKLRVKELEAECANLKSIAYRSIHG